MGSQSFAGTEVMNVKCLAVPGAQQDPGSTVVIINRSSIIPATKGYTPAKQMTHTPELECSALFFERKVFQNFLCSIIAPYPLQSIC